MCGMTTSNFSDIPKKSIIMSYFIKFVPVELAGLTAVFVTLIMIVLYCTLSSKLQHQRARFVIKKLAVSVLVVFIFIMAYNFADIIILWLTRGSGYSYYMTALCVALFTTTFWKVVLMLGYLLTFHFPNICNQLKKRGKKDLRDNLQHYKETYYYGTFRQSSGNTSPSSTYFSFSYTGEFTTM